MDSESSYIFIWFLVNGGSPFIGDFEVNPSGDPSFDISGPTRISNTGLELTPDTFESLSPNPFDDQIPFENNAPNLPISKYNYNTYHETEKFTLYGYSQLQ